MEYIGEKGGWISRPDSHGRCKQYYFFPLLQNDWKLEKSKSLQARKDVLTDLMKEMLPGNLLGSGVFLVSGWRRKQGSIC